MTSNLSDAVAAVADTAKGMVYDKPREPEDWLNYQQVEQPVDDEEEKM